MISEMTQHPVGQGGLFYGTLRHAHGEFKWLYDCGSFDEVELYREIDKISRKCNGEIDTLYLSHFHNDHIKGINYLTNDNEKRKGIKIEEAIIPYLNEYERIATLISHKIDGIDLNDEVREFIISPESFFFSRGFDRVIMIGLGRDDEDPNPVETSPRGPEGAESPEDEGEESPDEITPFRTWDPELKDEEHEFGEGKTLLRASSESVAKINFFPWYSRMQKWAFVTHARSISRDEFLRFKAEIDILKAKHGVKDAREIIGTKNWEKEFGICYKKVWKENQNSISMSLYIGPRNIQCRDYLLRFINAHKARQINFIFCLLRRLLRWLGWRFDVQFESYSHVAPSVKCGWLLTGDSMFRNDNYRIQFELRYQEYMPYVSVLMVPHHGSWYNVTEEFFEFFKNVDVCYVAANPDRKPFHPHEKVKGMIPESIFFHVVDTHPRSALTVHCLW